MGHISGGRWATLRGGKYVENGPHLEVGCVLKWATLRGGRWVYIVCISGGRWATLRGGRWAEMGHT